MNDHTLPTDETRGLIASDKVEGTSVYNPEGEKLGTIANFMVGKQSGQVEYAVLRFGGFLGLGADHYPLPWDMLTYDTDQDGYVVDISRDKLENAPSYGEVEPSFDRAYGEQVYGHYGLAYR